MSSSDQWPAISVVVPSYNQCEYLGESLASLFAQEYPRLEVVVMDGGSTDGSVALLREWAPRLTHWQSGSDGGQSAAINAGMAHATGTLVTWLNSDDRHTDDALWTVARAYRMHPGHGLYIGNGLRHVQDTGELLPFSLRHMTLSREDLARWTFTLQQPSIYFTRAAWNEVGGVDERLCYTMDWDIAMRIARRHAAVLIPEHLSISREHGDTKTRQGRFDRIAEIVATSRRHTGEELTPGALHCILETTLELATGRHPPELVARLRELAVMPIRDFAARRGAGYWSSGSCDLGDIQYVPLACADLVSGSTSPPSRAAVRPAGALTIVVVVLGEEGDPRVAEAITSVRAQGDETVEVALEPSASDEHRATVGALARTRGDIALVLRAGERLAAGALAAIDRAFVRDDRVGVVYGNALFVSGDAIAPVRVGVWESAFWPAGDPDVGAPGVLAAPRAAVAFRVRRLGLAQPSSLDAWLRSLAGARSAKVERTIALLPVDEHAGLFGHTYAAWAAPHGVSGVLRWLLTRPSGRR